MATEHTELRSEISQRARMAGGQPISQLMAKALMNPTLISLAAGFVDPASLPVDTVQSAIADVMSQRDSAEAALLPPEWLHATSASRSTGTSFVQVACWCLMVEGLDAHAR